MFGAGCVARAYTGPKREKGEVALLEGGQVLTGVNVAETALCLASSSPKYLDFGLGLAPRSSIKRGCTTAYAAFPEFSEAKL